MKQIYFLLIFTFFTATVFSQQNNSTCENASPFCTGTTYNFPAGVNAGTGQPGPAYGCLQTRPNPAWYYLKVLNPGTIKISMHSEPSHDIDFCCWGPFSSQYACDQLTSNKIVSCSYSPSATEVCNIANALTGQYYILIITNYSNLPCNIIFNQSNAGQPNAGSTDCSILPPPCNNNSPVCAGQTLQFTANSVANASYHWSGPNNFVSTLQNPSIPNAQPVNSGNYYLRINVNGQPSIDSSLTVARVFQEIANAGNDTSIVYGTNTVLHGSASGGSGAYHYHWEDASKLVDPDVQNPTTLNLYAPTVFTLTISDDSASCSAEETVNISLTGGPLTVGAVATPSGICAGATTTLSALGSGGTGNYTYSWTGPAGFSSNLVNPVVQPAQTSTYTVTISDGYNTNTSNVTVIVHPLPVANAGTDQTIWNGTYTFLNGSASLGSGNYSWEWTPADMLTNATVQSPRTLNLATTTLYSLKVTDLDFGCESENYANVTIIVQGGPLAVTPIATPDWICLGDSCLINAQAGGGNQSVVYDINWTSNPPGFTSTSPNIVVSPTVNTTYFVTVTDGSNTVNGNVTVSIYPQPQIHLGPPDSTVCLYFSVVLDAGNPGASYLWSNGDTTQTLTVGAVGITNEIQQHSVAVTNEFGCKTVSSINVHFISNACVGIEETGTIKGMKIYPNPTDGIVNVEAQNLTEKVDLVIKSIYGNTLGNFSMEPTGEKSSLLIDLSNLAKGIYLIKIETGSATQTQKLIIR